MAAEVGASLSGMEFSNAYAIAPLGTSLTKTAYYSYGSFYHADGTVLEGAGSRQGRSVIARALLHEPVYCVLDRADDEVQRAMRHGQPNFFLPFDRRGINPFADPFPVTMLLEGTVRGTGGVQVTDTGCATDVPGLYVAGDTATRELICGGFTGGGSHNAAWAMSSGSFAGAAAARFARTRTGPPATVRGAGGAGLRPTGRPALDTRDVTRAVQNEVLPYDKNLIRNAARMRPALAELDGVWRQARAALHPGDGEALATLRAREAAAMTAHARWMYTAALVRTETRGMHKREDFPDTDPAQHHRLAVGGLDEIWTASQPSRHTREAVAL